ncbi:MAG: hypothetical protein HY347_11810 [candidate division NC10 bacterium]|nr:hypothetical protein [candidate division NC10 bacterium]
MKPVEGWKALLEEVHLLRREVALLRKTLEEASSVEEALRRRGLRFAKACPLDALAFPPNLDPASEEAFYEYLKKYSFRLVLRDIIARASSFTGQDLIRFCSLEVVQGYLRFLTKSGIVQRRGRTYHLSARGARNFGETLEWFVAQVFRREFHCPALWGVRLLDVGAGGDYDVLAEVGGHLVCVEVKSSPPKHIDQEEVDAFFVRVEELFPALALFLVDTELRMKDKVVVMFEDSLKRRFGPTWKKAHPVTRLLDEIFILDGRICIANSKPSLVGNLGRCLRWWFSQRGLGS